MTDYTQRPTMRPRSSDLGLHDLLTPEQARMVHHDKLKSRGFALRMYYGGWRVVTVKPWHTRDDLGIPDVRRYKP